VNTDRLIDALSANLEPIRPGQFQKTLTLALVAGGAAAFGLMLATIGPRRDLHTAAHLDWLAIKLLFALSLIGIGVPSLIRSIYPGLEDRARWTLIFLPVVAFGTGALATLLLARPQAWKGMLFGAYSYSAVRCLTFILLFAAVPLAVLFRALRKGAPTNLERCGAIAGIVAGAVGVAVYAFSCASDSVPFITIWYGAAIAICGIIGAQLGPQLLRW